MLFGLQVGAYGAAVSGGSYQALNLTSPTFETASPIFGAASLKTGTGSATLTIPDGNTGVTAELWLKIAAPSHADANPLLRLTASDGKSFGFTFDGNNNPIPEVNGSNNFSNLSSALPAGATHLAMVWARSDRGLFWTVYSGGSRVAEAGWYQDAGVALPAVGAMALALKMPTDGTSIIDSLRVCNVPLWTANFTPPSGPLARNSNTLGLWHFNSSDGTGS